MEFERFREIVTLIKAKARESGQVWDNYFFSNFDSNCKDPLIQKIYETYETAFSAMDLEIWKAFLEKLLSHYDRNPFEKKDFFNHLNEAIAFKFLRTSGYKEIQFIKTENNSKTPDISYKKNDETFYCEVKTVHRSDGYNERCANITASDSKTHLTEEFISKICSVVNRAKKQISSYSKSIRGMAFVIISFDDFTDDHIVTFKKQIEEASKEHDLGRVSFIKDHHHIGVFNFE